MSYVISYILHSVTCFLNQITFIDKSFSVFSICMFSVGLCGGKIDMCSGD